MQAFLREQGCWHDRTESSHESWKRKGCKRPAIVDVKYDTLGDDLIRTILSALNIDKKVFREWLRR
jgi:hypothetical protein